MSRQIEEIALKMANEVKSCRTHIDCKDCAYHLTDACRLTKYAKRFAENGYRKASDVAREIMREVRQTLLNMILANSMGETYDIEKCFADIEKKYTEGQK